MVGSDCESLAWESCAFVLPGHFSQAIHKIYVNLPRSDLRKLSSTKSTAAPPNVIERSVLRGVRWSSEI